MHRGRSATGHHLSALREPIAPPSSDGGERPTARRSKPLAQWELLYYAANAEIRMMYFDLKEQHTKLGNVIIHDFGSNGTGDEPSRPISAIRLASILEQLWSTLTDPRVVAALDRAVLDRAVLDRAVGD